MLITLTNIGDELLELSEVDKGNFVAVSSWDKTALQPNEAAQLIATLPNTGYTDSYMDFMQSLSPIYSRIRLEFSYDEKVLPGLIQYLPQNEVAGNIAYDLSSENNQGAYHGVTLNAADSPIAPDRMPFYGSSAYCDLYSAGLNADLDGNIGSIGFFIQPLNAGVWADLNLMGLCTLLVDDSNYIFIYKSNVENVIVVEYAAGGFANQTFIEIVPSALPQYLALTWANASGRISTYLNGILQQSNAWVPGVWEGSLDPAYCQLGKSDYFAIDGWNGYIAHSRIYERELSAQEVSILANT